MVRMQPVSICAFVCEVDEAAMKLEVEGFLAVKSLLGAVGELILPLKHSDRRGPVQKFIEVCNWQLRAQGTSTRGAS